MGNETHAHTCRLTWKRDWKSRFLSERVAGYDDMKLEVGHPRSLMRIGRSRQPNNTYRTTCFPLQLFPWRRKCHWKAIGDSNQNIDFYIADQKRSIVAAGSFRRVRILGDGQITLLDGRRTSQTPSFSFQSYYGNTFKWHHTEFTCTVPYNK